MTKYNVITSALPYANGQLHIGHFFEATIADIKARNMRLNADTKTIFVSGADCHGAATTIYCTKNNLDISEHLSGQHTSFKNSYNRLGISFDNFSKTNTIAHERVVNWCLENILQYEKDNNIKIFEVREVLNWYDEQKNQFLPDRYIKGVCPHCGAPEQCIEVCEVCSKLIEPYEIKSPHSVESGGQVVLRTTKHLTINCEKFYEQVREQLSIFPSCVHNKILEQESSPPYLDISRDKPYYGIDISGSYFEDLKEQCFYVWFDAPIGYLTFAFEQTGLEFTKSNFDYFLKNVSFEHVIGKDILHFHSFLWLNLIKFIAPHEIVRNINLHGWLTEGGKKLSKSNGNSLNLDNYSQSEIDALRLYFFSKNDNTITDIEYSWVEVVKNYNNFFINNFCNFYTRSTKLLEKKNITISLKAKGIYNNFIDKGDYKKLYILLYKKLKELNSDFQAAKLWEQESASIIEEQISLWLHQWIEIYEVLCLVIPSLTNHESIGSAKCFHISHRIEE